MDQFTQNMLISEFRKSRGLLRGRSGTWTPQDAAELSRLVTLPKLLATMPDTQMRWAVEMAFSHVGEVQAHGFVERCLARQGLSTPYKTRESGRYLFPATYANTAGWDFVGVGVLDSRLGFVGRMQGVCFSCGRSPASGIVHWNITDQESLNALDYIYTARD